MNAYTVSKPFDLIGVVPHILGYRPNESLVLVTGSRGPANRGEVGLTLRFDYGFADAAKLDDDDLDAIAGMVQHSEDAAAVFPIVFSDEIPAALGLTGEEASDLLFEHFQLPVLLICSALIEAGYEVVDPLWTGAGFCGSLTDRTAVFDSTVGTAAEVSVRMIADGMSHADDFTDAVSHPPADGQLLADLDLIRREELSDVDLFDAALSDILRLHEIARGGSQHGSLDGLPTARGAVGIERMCEQLWSRDCIQMMLGFEHPSFLPAELGRLGPREFMHYARPICSSHEAAASMIGLSPERPDFALTGFSVAYLSRLVSVVSIRHRAAVLAILAWMEWSRARNSFAAHYASCALELDPDYTLAQLMSAAVAQGMPPAWMAKHQ
ncbi:DUF4192 family protein [Brevibacterium daeguense]|nr:DUF4192 family protein [Brevibacterium daeguense]